MKKSVSILLISTSIAACSSHQQGSYKEYITFDKPRTMEHFDDYVKSLKAKAELEGVSPALLNKQHNILYIQKAVHLDKLQAGKARKSPTTASTNQPITPQRRGNPKGATNYLNRVLTNKKVDMAEEHYWQQLAALEKASRKFGVQKEYLMSLWGMESSFGYYQGNYDVLSVLATLAFDGRREALFSKEFVAAMKMLERGDIQRHKMLGSWAGAMGQTQFMPSSYLRYAHDANQDGEKDIWKNHEDAFASIANYLHSVGWDDSAPWGVEVDLTKSIPLALGGIEQEKARSWQDWQQYGVILKWQTPQEQQKLTALLSKNLWLVRPDREQGRAFLVSNNFRTLLNWNKSNYFAVSIGMFADRIKQRVGEN